MRYPPALLPALCSIVGSSRLGFHVRGKQPQPGQSRFGTLDSPRAVGGFDAGSTGHWARTDYDFGISFLCAGLLEEYRHVARVGLLSGMIISALG